MVFSRKKYMHHTARIVVCLTLIATSGAQAMDSTQKNSNLFALIKTLKQATGRDAASKKEIFTQALKDTTVEAMTVEKAVKKYAAHKVKQAYAQIKSEWGIADETVKKLQESHKVLITLDRNEANTLNKAGGRVFFTEINRQIRSHTNAQEFISQSPSRAFIMGALDTNRVHNIISYQSLDNQQAVPLRISRKLICQNDKPTKLFHQLIIESDPAAFDRLSNPAKNGLCTLEITGKIQLALPTIIELVVHTIAQSNPNVQKTTIEASKSVQKLSRALEKNSFLTITCASAAHDNILQLLRECPRYRFMQLKQPTKIQSSLLASIVDERRAHIKQTRNTQLVVDLLKLEKELLSKNKQ